MAAPRNRNRYATGHTVCRRTSNRCAEQHKSVLALSSLVSGWMSQQSSPPPSPRAYVKTSRRDRRTSLTRDRANGRLTGVATVDRPTGRGLAPAIPLRPWRQSQRRNLRELAHAERNWDSDA